jgi:hypothetical protein
LKGHPEQALVHNSIISNELWHRRLAHINYRSLPFFSKMVTSLLDMQVEHDGVCKGCAHGKNAKGSFLSNDNRSKVIMDIIHSDVCEQMTVPYLGKFLYYVIFIDALSCKTWIYFLKEKDEVFNKFQEFKPLVENLSRRKIKVLRSHNGGEYTSNEFKYFCREVGIKRDLTTPYNPQHNGVANRRNRSIVEAAKAMIHDQHLPMHLWEEVSNTVVYVQNRSPHKILGKNTPKEVFTEKKPEVIHLRIFGYPVYIHIPKEKRTKLEPSGKKGTFIGYSETSKAYRIYIPKQRQIEISRDVTFDEEAAFKKYRESRMDEDREEKEAPRDVVMIDYTPEN